MRREQMRLSFGNGVFSAALPIPVVNHQYFHGNCPIPLMRIVDVGKCKECL
jgi:hypothetical protein